MLNRLLSNIEQIDACLITGDGHQISGEGEANIDLLHQAMKMAASLEIGQIEEMWFEGEDVCTVRTIKGGCSLWLSSKTLPVGRLSHEARFLQPVIEDLIEV